MISTLSGIITGINEQTIIIEQAGIGFELFVATPHNYFLNQTITAQTYLHWHQENGPTFYGFNNIIEKTVFLMIISCSGIGPKIGLAILHHIEPVTFLQAIIEENIQILSSIPGIGIKKAEQICVALKHKVAKFLKEQPELTASSTSLSSWNDLNETLTSLGYNATEIKSVGTFLKESNVDKTTPLSSLIRKSLAFLAKK